MNLKLLLEFDKWIKENPKGGIFVHDLVTLKVYLKVLDSN